MADRKQVGNSPDWTLRSGLPRSVRLPTDDVTPEVDAELGTLRAEHSAGTQPSCRRLMLSAGPETPLETRTCRRTRFPPA